MKKLLLSAALIASTNLLATEVIGNYHIGLGSSTNTFISTKQTGKEYTIGGSLAWLFESGLLLGGRVDYHYLDNETVASRNTDKGAVSLNAKIGYRYSDITVYGLGGYKAIQGNGDYDNYTGVGYGAGASWNVFDKVSIALEYANYSMNGVVNNFDNRTTAVLLKYGN